MVSDAFYSAGGFVTQFELVRVPEPTAPLILALAAIYPMMRRRRSM
jgi:hypothetical protein